MRSTKSDQSNDPLPGWLPLANRFVMWLQRRGLKTGTIHILTLPGRVTGEPRSTPVSMLNVDGQRYVIGGLDNADWVQNARADGRGTLAYGRHHEQVQLNEVEESQAASVLAAFPIEVPHGTQFFEKVHGVKPDPDEFAGLAGRCPVFLIDPA